MNIISKIKEAADRDILEFCTLPKVGEPKDLFKGRAITMAKRVIASRVEYEQYVAMGHDHKTALDMAMTYDMYKEITWRLGCRLTIATEKAVEALLKHRGEIVKCTVDGYKRGHPGDLWVPREDRGIIVPEHPKCANITRRQVTSLPMDQLVANLPVAAREMAAAHGLLEVAAVIYFILNNNVVVYVHISEDRLLPTDTMPDENDLMSRHALHNLTPFVLNVDPSYDTSKKPELKAATLSFQKKLPNGTASEFLAEFAV